MNIMDHFAHADLSAFTKRNYNSAVNHWIEYLKKPINKIAVSPIKSFEALKKVDGIKHTSHVYHGYLSAIIAYIKYHRIMELNTNENHDKLIAVWKQMMFENDEPMREHYKENKPTEKQEPQALSWEQVTKAREGLTDGIPKLLLSMYSLLTPERADYFELEILRGPGQKPTSGNYIDLTNRKLVMTEFKTAKKYERLEQDIPEELMRQINLSLKDKPREYLFTNRFKVPFTRTTFSQWANRIVSEIFGKRTTLTCIRHAYISSLDFNKSIRQLEQVSTSMGHSVGTQKTYAWIGKNEVVNP